MPPVPCCERTEAVFAGDHWIQGLYLSTELCGFCPHCGQAAAAMTPNAAWSRDRARRRSGGRSRSCASWRQAARRAAAGRGGPGHRPDPPDGSSDRSRADRGRHRRAAGRRPAATRSATRCRNWRWRVPRARRCLRSREDVLGRTSRAGRRHPVSDGAHRQRHPVRRSPDRLVPDTGTLDRGRRAAAARRQQRRRRHPRRTAGPGGAQDRCGQ